jgi:hypothetical protein
MGQQSRDADEIECDEVEQEVAFDHRTARLRLGIAEVMGSSPINRAVAPSSSLGGSIVQGHVRRDAEFAQPRHVIGCIVDLVLTHRDASAASLRLSLSINSDVRRSAVPVARLTMPATARPWRFSMVTCPM